MKAAYLVIALVVMVAAASGAYIWATRSQPQVRASGARPARAVGAEALENLEDQTESQFTNLERRIEDMDILLRRLEKNVDALNRSLESAPAAESPEPAPTEQENITPDPLREEVRRAVEEHAKERRERMFEESQKRFVEFAQRRIERIIDRLGWDEQKKQSVMAIVAEHQEEVRRVLEAARAETPPEAGEREALTERVRQVNAWTMDKLQAILTPEEAQQVGRVFTLPRGMPGPVPKPPPSGETPAQPEPGSGQ